MFTVLSEASEFNYTLRLNLEDTLYFITHERVHGSKSAQQSNLTIDYIM